MEGLVGSGYDQVGLSCEHTGLGASCPPPLPLQPFWWVSPETVALALPFLGTFDYS
jgi:hypothetical protein